MSQAHADLPRPHRLTVADYNRMAEVGILAPDARVELIDGEIIDMAPPGSLHAAIVNWLTRALIEAVGDRASISVQNPVRLSEYSEPQPDLALTRPRDDQYREGYPRADDVLLIVEVAASSLPFDLKKKLPLYGRHSIEECWIVDVEGKRLIGHRAPLQGAYTLIDEPDLRVALELSTLPDVSVDLRRLFG